jgi:hypothetical protein
VVAALNFANSRAGLAETQRQNRESSELQRRGQVTERFGKAIDQLGERGEKHSEKLDVRLGGIYALEQIAQDSPELHWPIVEVLTAFVREHTKADGGAQPRSEQPERDQRMARPKLAADIQAALTVLGRRNSDRDRGRVDLGRANVQGARLSGANLQGARLSGANLQGADLSDANLQGALLSDANLQGALLIGANLQGAWLTNATLQDALLIGAKLQGALLGGANLQGAVLSDANLQGALLGGASLQGANLEGAGGLTQEQLDSARCNDQTKPPTGLAVNVRPVVEQDVNHAESDDSK